MEKPSQNNASSQFLKTDSGKTKSNALEVPSISLPKGGGALKGIDEKFTVNAVNGTASCAISLPVSPPRGAAPLLTLSYNSGAGNGLFGLGWNLVLSSVRRKTDKGLPQYRDAIDSDTFLFSDTEDLVPEYHKEPDGSFSLDVNGDYIFNERVSADGFYKIRGYKPRIEGLFARIERWTEFTTGIIKWRVITRDNVTTLFGWSNNSVIADPRSTQRIFEWFPEFVFDDKGNCAFYQYRKEDDTGFDATLLHNSNRFVNGTITYTNCYLEKVYYGNKTPFKKFGDPFPVTTDFLFQTLFDYGEYDLNMPYTKIKDWDYRGDAFSDYKPGFEIRTTRLCKRVLLLHFFDELPGGSALVKSLNFEYDTTSERDFTYLKTITAFGYIKKPDGTYTHKNLPATEFEYQKHEWNASIKHISSDDLVHAPSGLDEPRFQFIDLFNEGLSGLLTEQANGWYYKHNLGEGKFEQAKLVTPKPSFAGLGSRLQLSDLDGDGGRQLVCFGAEPQGYFELDDENRWQTFRNFKNLPNIDFGDPNTRMLDLNGDGKPDVVITEERVFTWYESDGRNGYSEIHQTARSYDEERGPHVVFADPEQTLFLADFSGDGMTDIVRIRNGEVCYWPNLGYGKFGSKVAMDNAPLFDHPDSFNPAFLRLADIDGSGTTDLIYLGKNKFTCWLNFSGNTFSQIPFEMETFPEVHNLAKITVTDLLGNGVACIVWSDSLLKNAGAPLRYIDLMNSRKPHLLISYRNNLGKEVSLGYTPSTKYYIEDKLAGKPWITKLHFPVQCLSKTETTDKISGWRFVSSYQYHHGYYDHPEREFRGFGMVEQTDSEYFEHWVKGDGSNIVDKALHQEPVITRSWFHTGAFPGRDKILDQFAKEYWYEEMKRQGFAVVHHEVPLPDTHIVPAPGIPDTVIRHLCAQEWREALRACKSMPLRSEVFAHDAPMTGATADQVKKQLTPYSVATHNCVIELLQPLGKNKHAIFIVKEREAITYNYERDIEDPRIFHNLNIRLDEYGDVLESAAVVYPRILADVSLPSETKEEQDKTLIIYSLNQFTNDVTDDETHRLRLPSEAKTFELKGVAKAGAIYAISDFTDILSDPKSTIAEYHELDKPLVIGKAQRRLTEHIRTSYRSNNLTGKLLLHHLESLALPFESYQLAYTPELISDIFGAKADDALFTQGKFTHSEGDLNWWIRSGTTLFIEGAETTVDAQNRFYVPVSFSDPFGSDTKVKYYSNYYLMIEETEDEMKNKSKVDLFNFRTLLPQRMRDINNNLSEAFSDELGLVKAMALFGKGSEADDLTGLTEFTEAAEAALISQFFIVPDTPEGIVNSVVLTDKAKQLLQHATARFVYDFDSYKNTGKPAVICSIVREEHFQKNNNSPVQLSFEYSNGLGKVVMKKVQGEPGIAKKVNINPDNTYSIADLDTSAILPKQLRWIGNGRTVLNNKGNTVKQYEPYFSVTHRYEELKELVETGVTPLMYYDAMGRLVKTKMPDETFSEVEFDSWKQIISDANDTIAESPWYANRTNRLIDADLIAAGKDPGREKAAADKAFRHANTPRVMHFDTLGRAVLAIDHNKNVNSDADEFYRTRVRLDVEGNLRTVTDSRENAENGNKGNAVMHYKYDMLGNKVYQDSMDTGQRWLLINVLGDPLRTWDERNHEFQYFYDTLHRPTSGKVIGGDGAIALDNIYDRIIYGETLLLPDRSNEAVLQAINILGKAIKHFDTGGVVHTPVYNFKGQPTFTTRRLFKSYKSVVNWIEANLFIDLENDEFTFTTETDALGRVTKHTAPDGSITTPSYNEAGLLNSESVLHADPSITTMYIKDIDYNEKGQRDKIIYGNDVTTRFYYDKETFRLKRLQTLLPPQGGAGEGLQDWYYTYDPVGNITHIEDKNIPVVFFDNQKITGVSEYTFDALYRLVEAKGRENSAALTFDSKDNWNDAPFMHQLNPGDPMAVRNYTQGYQYDEVGNIKLMSHLAAGNNWTRNYDYEKSSNRLMTTQIGAQTYSYTHHPGHGFITMMPHLDEMGWSFKEELVRSVRQKVNPGNGTAETTWYQYNGQGQRIRKLTENSAGAGSVPTKKEERIYISGYETYRTYKVNTIDFERETLSLIDQGNRFVMVETVKQNAAPAPDPSDAVGTKLVRYQLHNHLGSSSLELDPSARVISYEEYHPFGTTAFQAKSVTIKAAAKRYRFTGMERDEETGLEYHSARYYLPWLGRWASADPGGLVDGVNLYRYSRNNPVMLNDPNGMDPPGSPVQITPLLTDISPTSVSGNVQFHNVFSASRSVSGQASLSGGVRSAFLLNVPALSLDTTGIFIGTASADVDTGAGTGQLNLQGGGVLGDISGLHLTAVGGGSLQINVPGEIQINQAGQTLLSALPGASGDVRVHGALQYGSLSLTDFSANATVGSGQFTGSLNATTIGNVGRLHLDASGIIGPGGTPSLRSVSATASVGVPGLSLNAQGTGTANPDGSLAISASANLRLFGLPSLRAQGTGTVSSSGADFQGTFSGAGPLYTSYITGDFSLSTSRGISGSAFIAGLTYSPSVDVSDPAPPPPGMAVVAGSARSPWVPGGLTIGASFFNYSHGNLNYVSAGFMPDLSSNIITNPRFGITSQWSF